MSVKNADLADLIATTLNDLPKQYFEIGWDNQDYEACRIFQQERMVVDGGPQIERKVMFDHSNNARYRRAYDTDEPTRADLMSTIKVPWTQIGTNYSWDKIEIMRNKNSAKGFIRLMTAYRTDGLWALAELIEERFWKTPESSTDDLYPYGVPYYITMCDADNSYDGAAGFTGQYIEYQDGNSGTVCANIDAATQAKWRNYRANYTAIDNALLKTFRLAFVLTKFKAPLIVNDPSQKENAAKRIYCSADVCVDLMNLADQRDDKHTGKDILGNLKVDDTGLCYINRLPVVPIPQLNGSDGVAAYDPIYCVDFRKFKPYVQEGYWMEESEPMTDRGQHTTFTVYLDGAHNVLCTNRREAGFVIHKSS